MVHFFSISVFATVGVHKCYEWMKLAIFTRYKSVFGKDYVREKRKFLHRRCFCGRYIWAIPREIYPVNFFSRLIFFCSFFVERCLICIFIFQYDMHNFREIYFWKLMSSKKWLSYSRGVRAFRKKRMTKMVNPVFIVSFFHTQYDPWVL